MSLPQPDLGVLRKAQRGDERAFLDHRPDVRAARLQLRPASDRRSQSLRGSDAGGLPPRLPGAPELLAALAVHDVALPGDEEPRARRAARDRAPAARRREPRGRAAARGRRRTGRACRDHRRGLARGRGPQPRPEDGAPPPRRRRPLVHRDRRDARGHARDGEVADLQGARGSPARAASRRRRDPDHRGAVGAKSR